MGGATKGGGGGSTHYVYGGVNPLRGRGGLNPFKCMGGGGEATK